MKKDYLKGKMPATVRVGIGFMLCLLLLSFMTPLLKGDRPIILRNGHEIYFFPKNVSRTIVSDSIWLLYPLIPISEKNIDLKRRLLPPLSVSVYNGNMMRHWAGTDHLGRDVAAGLIGGIWYALSIGFGVMFISLISGIILGGGSGWYGDQQIQWSPVGGVIRLLVLIIIMMVLILWAELYQMKAVGGKALTMMICGFILFICIIFYLTDTFEKKRKLSAKWIKFPLDSTISKIIEWLTAIPALLMILALTAIISQQNIWTMIGIISILTWPLSARLVRSEVLRRKYQPYLQQVRHLEIPFIKILVRDLLPNIWTPLIAVFAFGFSGVIMLDATLSFLGLGLPIEQVNWGNQIGGIRRHPEAWWLVVFPGMMIAGILISLNSIGSWLQEKTGARGRRLRWY